MSASLALREPLLAAGGQEGEHRSFQEGEGEAPRGSTRLAEELTVDEVLQRYVGDFGPSQALHFYSLGLAWILEAFQTLIMIFADREPEWRCISACPPSASLCDLSPAQWEWAEGGGASTVATFGLTCGEAWKAGLAGSSFFLGYLLSASLFGALSDGYLGRKRTLLISCTITMVFGFLTSLSPNFWVYALLRAGTGFGCSGIGLTAFVLGTEPIGPKWRAIISIYSSVFFGVGVMLLPILAYFIRNWRPLYLASTIPILFFCITVVLCAKESPRWLLVQGRTEEAMAVLRKFAHGNGRQLPNNIVLVTERNELNGEQNGHGNEGRPPMRVRPILPRDSHASDEEESVKRNDEAFHAVVSELGDGGLTEGAQKPAMGSLEIFQFGETRKRILIMIAFWLTTATVYYGLSLSAANLGADIYAATFASGFMEVPAAYSASIFLERIGRRIFVVSMLIISGVLCLCVAVIGPPDLSATLKPSSSHVSCFSGFSGEAAVGSPKPTETASSTFKVFGTDMAARIYVRLVLATVGKFTISAAYGSAYVYTAELFPTVVRNVAMALTTQAAQVGGMAAPMIVALGRSVPFLPFAVMGTMGVLVGALGLVLPETLNQPLLDTMDSFRNG